MTSCIDALQPWCHHVLTIAQFIPYAATLTNLFVKGRLIASEPLLTANGGQTKMASSVILY